MNTDELITAVVVDDHPFFRDGVARALSTSGAVRVVGEAGSGRDALDLIRAERPDVAVVDLRMPDIDGLGVVKALERDHSSVRVLMLSAETGPQAVYEALAAGARGYLPKDASREQMVGAVTSIAHGASVVPEPLVSGLIDELRFHARAGSPMITERERQMLSGIADGLPLAELGKRYFLSPNTVKTHVRNLYEKLGVTDRAEAVAQAIRHGLLE